MEEKINGITTKKRKGNVRYITISLSDESQFKDTIRVAQSFYDNYWYIIHDKDKDASKHLHIVCYDKNGTTLKAHFERFSEVGFPDNMICKVVSPRAILRYLIHKDNPEKFQYSVNEVVSNNLKMFFDCIGMECRPANDTQYEDFLKVRREEMSVKEFIKKYDYEFGKLNFYQRIMTFDKISKIF